MAVTTTTKPRYAKEKSYPIRPDVSTKSNEGMFITLLIVVVLSIALTPFVGIPVGLILGGIVNHYTMKTARQISECMDADHMPIGKRRH